MKVSLGRSSECDIVFDDPTISKMHAVINMEYYDDLSIEDRESKNGTFINDRKIKKAKLKETDDLRLGEFRVDMGRLLGRIFDKFRDSKVDFAREYEEMLINFKEYQKEKDRLSNPPKAALYIRLGAALSVAVVLIFYPKLIPNEKIRYGMMMSVGIVSILGSLMGPTVAKRNELLDNLRLKYEDVLVCPKCKTKLISNGYTFIKGRKRCVNDKCNAIY